MADIELVIKIPEELKNKIDNANEDNYRTYIWWFETTLYCAIKNGTPLPEGHGRLIDADALNRKDVNCANVPMNFIDTASTIVEAEKESEDI